MRVRKSAIFCFILFLAALNSSAQPESFTRFTTKDGLLSDEIYNLHQDKLGYIWIFTNYGALKYNSVEFKPVLKNLPFSESFIYSIYENAEGRKWVANSNAKIYEVINDSAFLVKGTESTSEKLRKTVSEIYQLYVDDSLNIYAITKQYSYKFVHKNNIYSPINLSTQIKYDSIVYRVVEKGNTLLPAFGYQGKETGTLFGREGRVGILLEKNKAFNFYEVVDLKAHGIPKFFKKRKGKVYFSFFDKLGVISEKEPISYIRFNSFISNFTMDRDEHVWVACLNNGIFELDENDSIVNHYLENSTVNDVLIDSQDGLWASTPGMGLFYFKNINNFRFKEHEPLAGTISLIKKVDNELFVANAKGDIFRIRNGLLEPMYLHNDHEASFYRMERALDVVKFNGQYYVSFLYGLKKMDIKLNTTSTKKIPNAIKILLKENDSIIYMHRRGFTLLVNEVAEVRVDVGFKTYDAVFKDNVFYTATENGIYIYPKKLPPRPVTYKDAMPITKDTLTQPDFLVPSRGFMIKKISSDPFGNLWFCSIGKGLFILDNSRHLKNITLTDGLPSNIINSVTFAKNNVILLSTNKGLYVSEYNNDLKFNWKRIYTGEVGNAIEFEDKIYVGTTGGLIIMEHNAIHRTEFVNFNLNAILINSAVYSQHELKHLKYYQSTIEFKFDVIHFSEDRSRIKYLLTGPVSDSGIVAGNSIKIQNLSPGSYTLTAFPDIRSKDIPKISIPFTILPAFWQTLSFLIIFGLFILAVAVVIVLIIFRNIKRKRDKKDKAEKLILEYKLIALKAQINPHFMSNCLSAIQLLIINNKVDAATRYVAKFGLLVRQILNFSTRSLVSVSEELEIAVLNMDLEQLRFENKFHYQIIVDEKIEPREVFVPALILNPIIENAVWHGLLPLKNTRQGELLIKVALRSDMLELIIEDNGVGRKRKVQNLSNTRQSKGIKLTEQRLNNINYLYGIETAKIEYIDLFTSDQSPLGTRVSISLPLNLKPLQYE